MAIFNPQVPNTNDPNWLGWSKSISQPQPDTSTGDALSSIGSSLSLGVHAADALVKDFVKDTTYDQTRKIVDDYTSTLEKADISTRIAAAAKGVGPGTASETEQGTVDNTELSGARRQPAGTPFSSLPGSGGLPPTNQAPPADLKSLPQDLGILNSARGNGKLSNTAYIGRLDALAKDLRSRYPGYRDYIDQEIHKVSGVNPANAYISSLLGDINSFANAGKAEANKVRDFIIGEMKEGTLGPLGPALMQSYLTGGLGNPSEALVKVMQVAAPARQLKYQLELSKARRAERVGTDEDTRRDLEADASKIMDGHAINYFNALHVVSGAPTSEKISEIARKAAAGEIKLDDVQNQALERAVRAQKVEMNKAFDDFLNQTGPDGRPNVTILGTERANQLKKFHASRFDDVADLIGNKDYGTAYSNMHTVRAMGEDDKYKILTSKELGMVARIDRAISSMGLSDESKKLFQANLQANLPAKFGEWLKKANQEMALQPYTAQGIVSTLKQQADDLKKRASEQGLGGVELAKTYDQLFSTIEQITKIKDPLIREGLAKAAFNEGNIGLLNSVPDDKFEQTPGGMVKFIPGKYSLYNRMFSPDMTKTMKQMPQERWIEYKDLGEHLIARELFGPSFRQLSDMSPDSGVIIGWNTEKNQIKYQFTNTSDLRGPIQVSPERRAQVKQTIDRMNLALSNYANIAKEEGIDVSTFLLDTLKRNGVDLGKIPGIPAELTKEIIRAKEAEAQGESKRQKEYGVTPPKPAFNPFKLDSTIPATNPNVLVPRGSPSTLIEDVKGLGSRVKDKLLKGPGPIRPPTAFPDAALPYNEESPGVPSSGVLSDVGSFLASPGRATAGIRNNAPAASKTRTKGNLGEILGIDVQGDNEDAFGRVNPAYSRQK